MSFSQYISYYWNREIDPRAADLPLVSSPYKISIIIFAYLYLVVNFGPRFMKRRLPYSLTTSMKLYNMIQIVANIWIIYIGIDTGSFSINLTCPVIDNDYTSIRVTQFLWYYFLLKIFNLIETVMYVLRKKNSQLSILHLYHHVSTLLLAWLHLRYYISIPMVYVTALNCFVHVIMYIYYFLGNWGPDVKKIVAPIKQWITTIQMIQFIVMLLFTLQQLMLTSCKVVDVDSHMLFFINVLINFYLFHRFYKRTYTKHKKTAKL